MIVDIKMIPIQCASFCQDIIQLACHSRKKLLSNQEPISYALLCVFIYIYIFCLGNKIYGVHLGGAQNITIYYGLHLQLNIVELLVQVYF